MDGREAPPHVEIELTEVEAPRRGFGRRRRSGDGPVVDPVAAEQGAPSPRSSVGDPTIRSETAAADTATGSSSGRSIVEQALGSERSRLVVTALGVGVVALALGWMLGRAGGDDGDGALDDTPPTTEDRTRESTVLTGETLPGVEGVEPNDGPTAPTETTTAPRPRPSADPDPVPIARDIELDPVAAALGVDVVGVATGDGLVRVATGPGLLITSEFDLGSAAQFGWVIVGDGWVVTGSDDGSARLHEPDALPQLVDLGDTWNLLRVPDTDTFWRPGEPTASGYDDYELVDRHGDPIGPTIESAGWWPVAVDPNGGLITVVQGSTYQVRPDGAAVIGRGDAVVVGSTTALMRVCDDELLCHLEVLDRATGASRTLDLQGDAELIGSLFVGTLWGGQSTVVAPDGSAAIVTSWRPSSPPVLVLIDLVTGHVVELGEVGAFRGIPSDVAAFTPDGRYVVHLGDTLQTPTVYDRTTGVSTRLSEALTGWNQLTLVAPTTFTPEVGTTVPDETVAETTVPDETVAETTVPGITVPGTSTP